jgi:hypothetical protein
LAVAGVPVVQGQGPVHADDGGDEAAGGPGLPALRGGLDEKGREEEVTRSSKGRVPNGWKPKVHHACVMKVRHDSASEATAAMQEAGSGSEGSPYECPFCDGWHWGRSQSRPDWPSEVIERYRLWAQLRRRIEAR